MMRDFAKARKNKFANKHTMVDGKKFDSKKESKRYLELSAMQKAEKISELSTQVSFELLPKQKDERKVSYIADFVYREDGRQIVEDVKSEITRKEKAYVIKRKLFKWRYPDIEFRET